MFYPSGAAEVSFSGRKCFAPKKSKTDSNNTVEYQSISVPHPHYERYMSFCRFKEFRRALPLMWTDYEKKSTDPWYRFSSAIDDFNTIRRQRLKCSKWLSVDESMSAWRPRTTVTGGLPNLSFVARKPEPLGTEFKNSACPILGVIRHLEIQRGKEGMRHQEHNATLGATTGCTIRLLQRSISDDEKQERHAIQGDAWFGSIGTCANVAKLKHEGVFQIKQYKTLYPMAFIEDSLRDAPGGIHIALSGKHQTTGANLVAVGYRYSRKTILYFIAIENAANLSEGDPYQMKYADVFGNVQTRNVDRPEMISNFFSQSNVIDNHNHLRQFLLALEKKWVTQKAYFRLATTLIGMNVVDTYLLMRHHRIIDSGIKFDNERMTITKFAGVLAYQLMELATGDSLKIPKAGFVSDVSESDDVRTPKMNKLHGILKKRKESPISSITFDHDDPNIIRFLQDRAGTIHVLSRYPKTTDPSGRKRTLCRKCVRCKEKNMRNDVGTFCLTCGEHFPLCNDPKGDVKRNCFEEHVKSFTKKSRRLDVRDERKVKMKTAHKKEENYGSVELRSRSVRFNPTAVLTLK